MSDTPTNYRALAHRGHRLLKLLRDARLDSLTSGLECLLRGALHQRCAVAVEGALAIWDDMNPKRRAKIEQAAADNKTPSAIARRCTDAELHRLIGTISADKERAHGRRNAVKQDVIEAYRAELYRRRVGAAVPGAIVERLRGRLTEREKERLSGLRTRVRRGEVTR